MREREKKKGEHHFPSLIKEGPDQAGAERAVEREQGGVREREERAIWAVGGSVLGNL